MWNCAGCLACNPNNRLHTEIIWILMNKSEKSWTWERKWKPKRNKKCNRKLLGFFYILWALFLCRMARTMQHLRLCLYSYTYIWDCMSVFVWLNAKMKPSRTQIRHAHHTQQAKCAKTFCIIQFLINKCSNFRAHFIHFALLNRKARKIENWSYLVAQNLTNNFMRAHQSKCVTRDRFQWICCTQSSNILCS